MHVKAVEPGLTRAASARYYSPILILPVWISPGWNLKRVKTLKLAIAVGSTALGGAVSAHHAFTAQYDPESATRLSGVVVKIEWLNPHAYFFIDVTDPESGEIETWACELSSPVGLMRQGWTRNSMAIGDVVTVDGARARDGSNSLNARSVVLQSTGQRLFTRTPEDTALGEQGTR